MVNLQEPESIGSYHERQPGGEAVVNEERFGGVHYQTGRNLGTAFNEREAGNLLMVSYLTYLFPAGPSLSGVPTSQKCCFFSGLHRRRSQNLVCAQGICCRILLFLWHGGTKRRFRASRPRPIVSASKASETFCPVMFGAPLLCSPRGPKISPLSICFLRLLPAAGT